MKTTKLLGQCTGCVALILRIYICTDAQSVAIHPTSTRTSTLDSQVRAEVAQFKGKVSLFAKNLDTGASYGFGADDLVRTASTIKVPIMVEAFARVAEGRARWTDELVLTKEKKVGGAGILPEFADGLRLTLRDAVHLMIVLSDNTATNLILDVLTADAVNARMDALGLKKTRCLRKVFGGGVSKAGEDPENKKFGLGVSTPREMVTLFEKLERGEVISDAASREMIAILKRQQDHAGIGRTLSGVERATKAGALDRLRSDIGIIYTKQGRIAMAITCDDMPETVWTVDNPGHLMLSRLSLILTDGLGKGEAESHTKNLAMIDKVELLKLRKIGDIWNGEVTATKLIEGNEAQNIASLWQAQEYFADSAACHNPSYGIKFYSQGNLIVYASLCWECDNIDFITPKLGRRQGFDGRGKKGQELLKVLTDGFPKAK